MSISFTLEGWPFCTFCGLLVVVSFVYLWSKNRNSDKK